MFLYFLRTYPSRTFWVLVALFVAAALEGLSVTAVLPLIAGIIARQTSSTDTAISGNEEVMTSLARVNEWFDKFGGLPSTGTLIIGITLAVLAKSLIIYYARIYAGYTATKVAKDLRLRLLRAIAEVDWSYYISQPAGKISSSLMQEAQNTSQGYTVVTNLISCLIQIFVYSVIAMFLSWQMAIAVFLLGGVLILSLNKLIMAGKSIGTENTSLARAILIQLNDSLRNIKSLKAMNCTQQAEGLLYHNTKKLARVQKHLAHVQAAITSAQDPILVVSMLAGIYASIFLLHLPLEATLVIMFALVRMLKTAGKAQKLYQEYLISNGAYNGIIESVNIAEHHYEQKTGSAPVFDWNQIRFEHVTFKHKEQTILRECSVTFNRHQLISLVGPSGTGKTTFIDLLAGLYQPQSGRILVDDMPLEDFDIRQWRKQLGYVMQEITLLHTSIAQNVALGDISITEDKIIQILKQVRAWDFIETLPEGLHTEVGEQGGRLSGGQRQRILIARALARKPKLLIIDEATSALDKDTEVGLAQLFKQLSESMTIISISHRPAIVDASNIVFTLKDGQLLQQHPTAAGAAANLF